MKYPKIQTLFKRDMDNKGALILDEFSCPEFGLIPRWLVTEKIDGMNIRIYWSEDTGVLFHGRTDNAQIPAPLGNYMKDKFTPELLSTVFRDAADVVLYGEGYGAKIQKGGGNYRPDQAFILFDVVVNQTWLDFHDVIDVADNLGTPHVFSHGLMETDEIIRMVRGGFLSMAADSEHIAEGIVARCYPMLLTRRGKPLKWKLKYRDFKEGGD